MGEGNATLNQSYESGNLPCTEDAGDASRQDLSPCINHFIAHDFLVKQMPRIQYMTHLVLSSTSWKNTSATHRIKTRATIPTASVGRGLSTARIFARVLYRSVIEELVRNGSIVSQSQADYKHRAADGLHMRLGPRTKLFQNYGC